jgi:hypothetical protein
MRGIHFGKCFLGPSQHLASIWPGSGPHSGTLSVAPVKHTGAPAIRTGASMIIAQVPRLFGEVLVNSGASKSLRRTRRRALPNPGSTVSPPATQPCARADRSPQSAKLRVTRTQPCSRIIGRYQNHHSGKTISNSPGVRQTSHQRRILRDLSFRFSPLRVSARLHSSAGKAQPSHQPIRGVFPGDLHPNGDLPYGGPRLLRIVVTCDGRLSAGPSESRSFYLS